MLWGEEGLVLEQGLERHVEAIRRKLQDAGGKRRSDRDGPWRRLPSQGTLVMKEPSHCNAGMPRVLQDKRTNVVSGDNRRLFEWNPIASVW